jgi:MFS family permease
VAKPTASLRLIGTRNFGTFFLGNAASATGTWFQNLAAALVVYRLTHSAFLLGVLNFCNFLPVLVLAPWAGAAADRFDRRRLMLATQLGAAAVSGTLAMLAWAGLATIWVVIMFATLVGIASAVASPAAGAIIADLVHRNNLASAVALNSMTFSLARAIGPALAALSVRALGVAATFGVSAGAYLVFVVALLLVRTEERLRASPREARVSESVRLLRRQPELLAFLLIVTAVGFASDPINTEAPAFAHAFGRLDTDAGYIIGAFGFGAVVAALIVVGRVAGGNRRMFATLLLLIGGLIGFCVSPNLPLGLVFLTLAGAGYLTSNTSVTSRLQLRVADHQRGRIMALWSVGFMGLRPVASITDGAIAGTFGVRAAGIALTLPAIGAVLAISVLSRRRGWSPGARASH